MLNKTNITANQIGEYTGQEKIIKPITITTYQMLTHRRAITESFPHLELFTHQNWGLIIYDEVHSVDLPDANVLIETSGMFGSRQEEAQRLGRILRPKERPSFFYTRVSKGTSEQEFAVNRQMFLVEQGCKYQIRYFE